MFVRNLSVTRTETQYGQAQRNRGMWLQMSPNDSQAGGRATGTQGLGLSVPHRTTLFLPFHCSAVSLSGVSPFLSVAERSFPRGRKHGHGQPQFRDLHRERKSTHFRGGLTSALFELCTQSLPGGQPLLLARSETSRPLTWPEHSARKL